MSSSFSLEREKDESNGGGLVPTRASELGVEKQRTEHLAFLEEQGKDKGFAKQAGEALRTAHLTASPNQLFEAIGGFSIDLDEQEAEQLRQVPRIKSCEADEPLELTDPVESESVGV